MNTLIKFLSKTSTKSGFALLFVFYALVFGGILITLSDLTQMTGGIGILDFDRGYTLERVLEVLGSYGETGFTLYSRIQLLDLVNPALYSLLMASLLYLLYKGQDSFNKLIVLPFLAGFLDYAENATLFLIARSYPDVQRDLVAMSSMLNIIKYIVLFGTILALVVGIYLCFLNRSNISKINGVHR